MVLFRGALEGTYYFVFTLVLLTMVTLGNEYVVAGIDSATLQPLSNALYQVLGLTGDAGTILFICGAVCLYISFFRTRLIPRWLTIWGLIGVVPYLANSLLQFFHVSTSIGTYLEVPLMIQELVMGLWLVIKGFNPSTIATLSTKTE